MLSLAHSVYEKTGLKKKIKGGGGDGKQASRRSVYLRVIY